MSNVAVQAGDAETTTKMVLDVLNEKGISFSKVVGLGSDGAAVMTGNRNGVGMKLKNLLMRVRVQTECQQHFPIF